MSDKLTDKLVGDGVKPELSPNPNGSGYTKQVEVDALSSVVNPEGNVLYICQGRKYKYLEQAIIDPAANKVLVPSGFVRVDNGPLIHLVKGERGTPVHENVAPQVQPRVFNEPVALNGGVTIKGKQIEDYIDSQGGVTQSELDAAVTELNNKIANVVKVGSQINLGAINVHEGDTNTADFYKELTEAEFNAIADGGLCILLFNTTCAIFPYVKAYDNRTVVNAIAYNNGATMVTRIKLTIDGTGPRTIVVNFEEAFADALAANANVRPYGVIQFIKLG